MIPSISRLDIQAALLQWADFMLTHLGKRQDSHLQVRKPEDLFDGAVFSALLEVLDNEYSPTRFQESLAASSADDNNSSHSRRRALHVIHTGLIDLARRHCPKIDPLIKKVDFQALNKFGMFEVNSSPRSASPISPQYSQDRSPSQTSSTLNQQKTKAFLQILVLFVSAAILGEVDNTRYINLVIKLPAKAQSGISDVIKEVKKLAESEVGDGKPPAVNYSTNADDDLAHEAKLAQLQRDADEARKQAVGLKLRLDRLQDNYEELVRKHEELQDENEQLHKQIESEAGNFDKHRLQRQLKENEALIANLENETNHLAEERDRLAREKARLEVAVEKVETLSDENQELRSRNEDLSKKANMADNLRKKLETMKPLEAELKTLRNDRIDAAKLVDQLDNATMRIETLKREAEAYATKMQGYEIDIADFSNQKTMYTTENTELRLRLEELQQRSQVDEGVLKEMQEKLMMLDPSAAPSTPEGPRPTSLEDELNGSSNAVSMRDLEVQRLQAENAVLKSSIGTETDKGRLIQEMEDSRNSRQALQEKFNELLEKYTVGQHQLDALIQNMGKDGLVTAIQACYDLAPDMKWLMSDYFREEAYSNLRTQVLAEQNRAKQFERQLSATKEQLADKERALLEARGDCKNIFREYVLNGADADNAEKVNAVEKSSLETLAELKNTDGLLAVSLRAELDMERRKHKALKEEFEAQRAQLLTAFIEKDELRRDVEAANRELQKAADGQTVSTDSIKQSEKMEKLRTRYKQLQQVSRSFPDSEPISDGDGDDDDDDDRDVVKTEVKRQTVWQALKPWFRSKKQRPRSGFHPYEVNDDGSISAPTSSTMGMRGGSFSHDNISIISGISGYNSPSLMSQLEQSELKNRELERTLKAVRAGSEAGAQKAQADQVIKNLQRENAMIATAWYDLTSRLQSNHVVLQRRHEVPKSWLNKQRQMVNGK
ncbi:hypothetical protein F4779DRAFT_622400 [Xylariaceae sp. FL0662B]|nr:hypothetical protein F4779DRAFT_622400 [Xylariaceae sp. FL0662B]